MDDDIIIMLICYYTSLIDVLETSV